MRNAVEVCLELIDFGANFNILWTAKSLPFLPTFVLGSPLYNAAKNGYSDMILFLIEHRA
ncbi:MAG: hypothetical protein J7641_22600 [Cyanobacteria bacterium SID2]|nr:hypothetical protein [Cyanobacteria bacterium SID2]MBP0005208.1 hypothetical protein [Cyanobacteria bacterium SBC]